MAYQIRSNIKSAYTISGDIFLLKFERIYPIDAIKSIVSGIKLYNKLIIDSKEINQFRFNAKQKAAINERELYVLVIGETARYSSFSINNYKRKTSPLLEKTNSIVSFNNVYSEANSTAMSVPILISRANAFDFERRKKEKTILAAFSEAGFSTYWIGNQGLEDEFIQQAASQVTKHYFTSKDIDYTDSYDQILWKYLDEILKKNEQKQFIVLHTLGSHFRYNFRYPDSFNKFKPSFSGAFGYDQINRMNRQKLINTYDNSILYTDFFLGNTIQKINNTRSVSYLYYISDHGENLYEKNTIFHGGEEPTKFDVHVPLIIWTSDKYNMTFSEKISRIKLNSNQKISSSRTFHSLLDMANIRIDGEELKKSIASKQFTPDTIRYMLNSKMEVISVEK